MYNKQNSVASDDDKMTQLEKNDAAQTNAPSYGGSGQGGASASSPHVVSSQKPAAQAQKEKDQDYQKTLTQWSYWNIGNGVNIARQVPPAGEKWYSYPPVRQETAKVPASTQAILTKWFPQMPKSIESAMPSNSIMQANYFATAMATAELMNAPKRQAETAKSNMGAQQQEMSDAAAGAAESGFTTGMELLREPLINVANEGAGTPTSADAGVKSHSQAIWMVQQIYKTVYLPMAILLLLPGAILTNMKSMITGGIIGVGQGEEDAVSPFSGILRSVIAIFLIPATQLFASWCIDVGNSMTFAVNQNIAPAGLSEWMQEQTFNAPLENAKNALSMPKDLANATTKADESGSAGGGVSEKIAGKIDGGSEKRSQVEQQSSLTRMMQLAFNMLSVGLNFGMLMLSAFQIVMVCYLFLMAPIAAAFFAWPSGVGSLFKTTFTNWLDALINVTLWKFWWCVVVLCMQTRNLWLEESGSYLPNSQWEMAVYVAFMVILLYVPFVPFEYKPGEMVSKILEKAEQLKDAAASGANSGGGGGGGGGGGAHGGRGSSKGSRMSPHHP